MAPTALESFRWAQDEGTPTRIEQALIELMGGELDAAKTISSLTLFEPAGVADARALGSRASASC